MILGAGFAVDREDVDDSSSPAGIVVGQSPPAGTQQGKGSVITLQVSTGPATSQVPDVTSQTEADARGQVEASGFEVQVVEEIVDDESLDGKVLSQTPEGGHGAGGRRNRRDRHRPLRGAARGSRGSRGSRDP